VTRNQVVSSPGVPSVFVHLRLVASLLRFPLLDTFVGLAVALLILKSAVELAIETVPSLGEEEMDLSRFEFGLVVPYERFRRALLRDWMLYLVGKQGVETRTELIAHARQALSFQRIPALQALGLVQSQPQDNEAIERTLSDLLERDWLAGEEQLSITVAGRKRLRQRG
jgi:hypothetical protein